MWVRARPVRTALWCTRSLAARQRAESGRAASAGDPVGGQAVRDKARQKVGGEADDDLPHQEKVTEPFAADSMRAHYARAARTPRYAN